MQTAESRPESPSTAIIATLPVTAGGHPGNLGLTKERNMPNFVFAYHGGKKPESAEEGAKLMAKWKTWVGGLGDAVVNPGTPL